MGVAIAFQAISNIDGEYPLWFSEGKTSLIPKPGEFTSDNQRKASQSTKASQV